MSSFKKAVLAAVVGMGCALAAMEAGAVTTKEGAVTVQTTLTGACEVSGGGTIQFGTLRALASTGDQNVVSTPLQVACSSGLSPVIYSSSIREMSGGGTVLPFDICLGSCSGAGSSLAKDPSTAQQLGITKDGTLQPVTLGGQLLAANFQALPAGAYTTTVTVSVDY